MRAQYYFLFAWMVVVAIIHYRAVGSRWGWALRAIRENEIAAGVLGVNVNGYRFLALGVSAFLTGVCGGLYAHLMGLIEPAMVFSLQLAAFPLVLSFFGGRFTVLGPDPWNPGALSPGSTGFAVLAAARPCRHLRPGDNSNHFFFPRD